MNDLPNHNHCSIFNFPFSIQEFEAIIKKLRIKSSPGLDQIDYSIISSLPTSYYNILLSILNELLDKGFFPDSWTHSFASLIPKNSPEKFRPISLTSCLLKILEKLILTLDWWVESKDLLPNTQFGFRKRKSCHDWEFLQQRYILVSLFTSPQLASSLTSRELSTMLCLKFWSMI